MESEMQICLREGTLWPTMLTRSPNQEAENLPV